MVVRVDGRSLLIHFPPPDPSPSLSQDLDSIRALPGALRNRAFARTTLPVWGEGLMLQWREQERDSIVQGWEDEQRGMKTYKIFS